MSVPAYNDSPVVAVDTARMTTGRSGLCQMHLTHLTDRASKLRPVFSVQSHDAKEILARHAALDMGGSRGLQEWW